MRRAKAGGGWHSIRYALGKARQAGGVLRLYRALRSRNACKTCALGMGGQRGGMVDELGRFPQVCKKSIQAMAADMRGAIRGGFFEDFDFRKLRTLTPRELEAAGRLTEPLCARPLDTGYRRIGWDEALDRAASALRRTRPDEAFFYFSGRSSNEAGFLYQLFARLWGTNNVNNCSYYCHQASGVALRSVTGSGTATVVLADLDHCDLVFLIGANPASNHPRFMSMLMRLRRRGGKVVVVNPLREVGLVRFKVPSDPRSLLLGTAVADLYVQPHVGGDIAFLAGVAKAVLERGAEDREFTQRHASGWAGFREHVQGLDWVRIVEESGVGREAIERAADLYCAARAAIFCWAMGVTHHEHGADNVRMIANLAMTRGMLGRPHRGLLPLRGHSNVQGMGSVGVVPRLGPRMLERLEQAFGVRLPRGDGLDTLSCVSRAAEGGIRFASCLGGNLFGCNPDAAFTSAACARIDLIVYLSTALNTGHVFGRGRETIVLPVLPRDEEPQPTTQESMFNHVRLSEGGAARHEGPRSEVDVVIDLAGRVLGDSPVDWERLRSRRLIREAIAKVVPGYEAIGHIDRTRREFQIAGRTFHEPSFATDDGRARFHAVPLPALERAGDGCLRLTTVRSEGQFNTVVYEDEDVYRGQERRDVVLMHPRDIERLGLRADQRVVVRSATGSMEGVLVRPFDIRAGNAAMYYPEANALVARRADPESGTPTFKNTIVWLEPAPPRGAAAREPVAELAGAVPRGDQRAC